MNIVLKCKSCEKTHKINLDSEYYLPTKCPSCGYHYQDYALLKQWLEQVQKQRRGNR